MEVSGQLHVLATLFTGKELLVPTRQEAEWAQRWSGCGGEEKESLLLHRIEHWSYSP
jgi:hypothetical protein